MSAGIPRTDRTVGLSRRLRRGQYSEDGAAEARQRFGARQSKLGTLGSRAEAASSSRGGALRPRPDRVLRVVAADGNVGGGRMQTANSYERFAASQRIAAGPCQDRATLGWFGGGRSQTRASSRNPVFGPANGSRGRRASPKRDDVRGTRVTTDRDRFVARAPPQQVVRRRPLANRTFEPESGLRIGQWLAGTANE
jgi:hypothetical protein